MNQRSYISQVNLLSCTCLALTTMLILGSACNSPPVLYRLKNPGRRGEPLAVSQNSSVKAEPAEPLTLASLQAEHQPSHDILQQSATSTLSAPNSTELSLADAVSAIENSSNDTPSTTNTELTSLTNSAVPMSSVMLASSQVDVQNAVQKSVPAAQLVIAGVRPSRGKIKIAIFTESSSFPNPADATQVFELAATNPTMETSLPSMKQFAVAVYQDINSDGELNRNRFGIPTEPFAFSNNAMGKRGPPSFEQAVIVQPTEASGNGPLVVTIQLP